MKALARLPQELGRAGITGLVLFVAFLAFSFLVLQPLEEQNARLRARVAQAQSNAPTGDAGADKVAAVYRYLATKEEITDWLAKLHGIGTATGVQLKSASYRKVATQTPIERYEILLPVAGTYPRIRDFLSRATSEIPVLSVDGLTLKRETSTDGALQTELRLTLHMVKP